MVGNSGAGKSTVGRALADALGVPFVELDSIYHQPGWRELPADEFVARTRELAAQDGWVIDGNYSLVREPVVWPRADTVVWLDLPRHRVMRQVTWRSVRRVALRQELWNGNRERVRNLVGFWKPEESMIAWAWTRHGVYRERYGRITDDPRWAHLDVVRLTSRNDVARLLAQV